MKMIKIYKGRNNLSIHLFNKLNIRLFFKSYLVGTGIRVSYTTKNGSYYKLGI